MVAEPDLNIQSGIAAVLHGRKRKYPCHVNRISALDEPCLRRLYYLRHDWDKASDTPDGLQGVFETGTVLESVIQRIVSEVGEASSPRWRIVGSQMPTNDALLVKYQIAGTIDGFLQMEWDGRWVTVGVVDIKTMSANIYPTIHGYADLARYPWTRKYRGQIMLYALAHNQEQCHLLLVNKQNLYEMKLVSFPLDLSYCEALLAKAEAVNAALADNTPPPGVNDPDECPRCPFYSFCAPDLATGGDLQIVDNAELEAVLDRLDMLAAVGREMAELEKVRDALLVKGQDVACGTWLVTWKRHEIHYQAQPARQAEQWRKKVVRTLPAPPLPDSPPAAMPRNPRAPKPPPESSDRDMFMQRGEP